MDLTGVKDILQTFVLLANSIVIAFGFYKFLGKPHSTLEQRVAVLESKVNENENRLRSGNKRFDELEEKNKVFMHCMLCFIDFEIRNIIGQSQDIGDCPVCNKKSVSLYDINIVGNKWKNLFDDLKNNEEI